MGWVGDDIRDISPHLSADADLAGCTFSQGSTTGVRLVLQGPNTSFPIAGGKKRQGCVSNSAIEAELVATAHGLRHRGFPAITLFETLLGHKVIQAMIQCVRSGKDPTMRHAPTGTM